jgi:hypothetical protein
MDFMALFYSYIDGKKEPGTKKVSRQATSPAPTVLLTKTPAQRKVYRQQRPNTRSGKNNTKVAAPNFMVRASVRRRWMLFKGIPVYGLYAMNKITNSFYTSYTNFNNFAVNQKMDIHFHLTNSN